MSLSVRVGGSWRNASDVHTRVGGAWKKATKVWVRVNGSWKEIWSGSGFKVLANMSTARCDHHVQAVGNYIYTVGGFTGSVAPGYETKRTERYDPATNTWAYMADTNARKVNGTSFVINNEIYIQGGNGDYSTGLVYTPSTNTYRYFNQTRSGESQFSGGIGSFGYVAGGYDGGFLSLTYMYNPGTDSRTKMADIPIPLGYGGSAVAYDNLYTVGGQTTNYTVVTAAYQFDPRLNVWTAKASAPVSNSTSPSVWAYKNIIYAYFVWDVLWLFDPWNNVWVQSGDKASNGTAIYRAGAAVVGGKAYIPGGLNANDGVISGQTLEYTMA